jgi:MoaA/NifB/PqqE/SkfB family radical SAM enzyme
MIKLETIFFHLTKACSLSCTYCYFSARSPLPNELSTNDIVALFPDVVTLAPRKIVFTGGEPLLRKDLVHLLRMLRATDTEHCVLRCLNTNGLAVTPAVARSLIGLVDEVRVSVDALRERNDALRGRGSFDAAIRALEVLYAVGFEPKALVTANRETLPDLVALVQFLRARGIRRINVNSFRPMGRGADKPEWKVNPDELAAAVNLATGGARSYCKWGTTGCGVGSYVNILPDGEVYPCHVLSGHRIFRLGNVREQPLKQICRRGGQLERLAGLSNDRMLSSRDPRLLPLIQDPAPCMGDVYDQTADLTDWSEVLVL